MTEGERDACLEIISVSRLQWTRQRGGDHDEQPQLGNLFFKSLNLNMLK